MTNHISPESAEYLSEAVRSGTYQNETQALDEAVSLLKQRDQLRADVQAGREQADRGELIPADEVFERLAARARQIEEAAGGRK